MEESDLWYWFHVSGYFSCNRPPPQNKHTFNSLISAPLKDFIADDEN